MGSGDGIGGKLGGSVCVVANRTSVAGTSMG